MAVVCSKVLLIEPPLIYTAPDTCVFGAVTHDRRTLSIDLPTRITIPIFHRLRLNQFLRKRGNNVVVELVCTQSGRTEQLSAPTEYMVKNDVTFSIV